MPSPTAWPPKGLPFAGVLANGVAGAAHAGMLRSSVSDGIPYRGTLYRRSELAFPERHLGLVQAQEIDGLDQRLDALAAAIGETELADLPEPAAFSGAPPLEVPRAFEGVRIGIARDPAFSFVYPANLDLLRAMGEELRYLNGISSLVYSLSAPVFVQVKTM